MKRRVFLVQIITISKAKKKPVTMKIKIGNILLKILLPMQKTSDMIALDKIFLSQNFVKFVAQSSGVAAVLKGFPVVHLTRYPLQWLM